jgi:DNA-binding MarR family transcriptional regulator
MDKPIPIDTIRDLLGSAEVFTSAIDELVERRLAAVSQNRLTFTQLRLLQLFSLTDAHSVSDVALYLGVSNAAASRAVDWLVKHRYVRRTERPSDRRAVKLSLTPTGRKVLESFEEEFLETVSDFLKEASAAEMRRTVDVLDRLSLHLANQLDSEGGVCFRCGLHFRKKCPLRTEGRGPCHMQLSSFKAAARPEEEEE